MATQADVRRLALALPGAQESSERFGFFVRNGAKDKGFAWVWLQRVDPRKPRVPCPDVLAVRVANNDAKEMLLLAAPTKFFTEPHYNGFPAVLVRLKEMSFAEMRELLREAWAIQAPKAVTRSRKVQPAAETGARAGAGARARARARAVTGARAATAATAKQPAKRVKSAPGKRTSRRPKAGA